MKAHILLLCTLLPSGIQTQNSSIYNPMLTIDRTSYLDNSRDIRYIFPLFQSYQDGFALIRKYFPNRTSSNVKLGVYQIFNVFEVAKDSQRNVENLRRMLQLSQDFDIPIHVKIDGEVFRNNRPDLWNWHNPNLTGYDPKNRFNVEWANSTPAAAMKLSWVDWGKQIRVAPAQNFLSPKFQEELKIKFIELGSMLIDWWDRLPKSKKYLFGGIHVGWETNIGAQRYFFRNGNALYNNDGIQFGHVTSDPSYFSRAKTQQGYAALITSGMKKRGEEITWLDTAKVVTMYFTFMGNILEELGFPKDVIFSQPGFYYTGPTTEGLTTNTNPGMSFYYQPNIEENVGWRIALDKAYKMMGAKYWGAIEWFYDGTKKDANGKRISTDQAIRNYFNYRNCRFINIVNWDVPGLSMINTPDLMAGVQKVLDTGVAV